MQFFILALALLSLPGYGDEPPVTLQAWGAAATYTITLPNPYLVDGLVAATDAYNAATPEATLTPEQYLQRLVAIAAQSYAKQYGVGSSPGYLAMQTVAASPYGPAFALWLADPARTAEQQSAARYGVWHFDSPTVQQGAADIGIPEADLYQLFVAAGRPME